MEKLASSLTAWIRERVLEAGQRGVIVGLSGGLDSAVVAVLAKRAFPENCMGIVMPCQSSEADVEHAEAVARQFNIPVRTVSLDETYDSLLRSLPTEGLEAGASKLAEANLKPRLRMVVLYYVANRLQYLVAGTGNRSEISVGYFTKFGDGGVDILPLGNLVKSEVRELARHLGIPEEILRKPPSGGLWEGQTDEDELGITYLDLDRYLVTGQATKEVKDRVDGMMSRSEHKRATPPVPPFGGGKGALEPDNGCTGD
ncbi:MAG: NAD+ synthase [Chloroflexota bacterium]|nr:NAD+ synthase [Chloroflexota bacterium]